MKNKIQNLIEILSTGLVEREAVIKAILLALFAGENAVIVGPPGTGKSLIVKRVAHSLVHTTHTPYFEYLLTKFSTPEEIFGPLSLSELKVDRYKRNTEGYLPQAQIAFLDEIFKANSSILNALLSVLNERIYHNGIIPQQVPLQCVIAASNELPIHHEELAALYDRFLIRLFVDYVSAENRAALFNPTPSVKLAEEQKLQLNDLSVLREQASQVQIPDTIVHLLQEIWAQHQQAFQEDRREQLSDRRLKKVIHLMQVSAITNDRKEIDFSDVFLLKNCLWNCIENQHRVQNIIFEALVKFNKKEKNVFIEKEENKEEKIKKCESDKKLPLLKGYEGQGTIENPILIQSAEDLANLDSVNFNDGYYHFLQTTDIDITSFETWPKINFQGNYDGGGFTIKADSGGVFFFRPHRSSYEPIFSSISNSYFENLTLINASLAGSAIKSNLKNIHTGASLIYGNAASMHMEECTAYILIRKLANDCIINNCKAGIISEESLNKCIITYSDIDNITNKNVVDCKIENCTFQDMHIEAIKETVIINCLIKRKYEIIKSMDPNSKIINCFIYIEESEEERALTLHPCIIEYLREKTLIENCVISRIGKMNSKVSLEPINNYINVSIVINSVVSDSYRVNSDKFKTVAHNRINQRYLENTLGWDFEKDWQWDTQKNIPVLQSFIEDKEGQVEAPKNLSALPTEPADDLLAQQLKANIWI